MYDNILKTNKELTKPGCLHCLYWKRIIELNLSNSWLSDKPIYHRSDVEFIECSSPKPYEWITHVSIASRAN